MKRSHTCAIAAALLLAVCSTAGAAVARDHDTDRDRGGHAQGFSHDDRRGDWHDRDRDGRPDRGWGEHHDHDGWHDGWHPGWHDGWSGGWHAGWHDRYWRPGYRGYVSYDRMYVTLRGYGYSRWVGAPYWVSGRYVVRCYDPYGRVVFVELNPYTAAFVGVMAF